MEYKSTSHPLTDPEGRVSDPHMLALSAQFNKMVTAYFSLVGTHLIASLYGPTLVCIWVKDQVS